jgi:hypothetical protein
MLNINPQDNRQLVALNLLLDRKKHPIPQHDYATYSSLLSGKLHIYFKLDHLSQGESQGLTLSSHQRLLNLNLDARIDSLANFWMIVYPLI